MKTSLIKSKSKTVWYENKAIVNEYLDNENSRKTDHHEKDWQSEKLSWLDIIKRTWPLK